MGTRVLLVTTDLVFRSKLAGAIAAAGGEVTRDEAQCDLAVLELGGGPTAERVGELVRRGVRVLAFGAHVQPDALRAARAAGATAVPNSQVEARLRELLRT